MSEQYVIYDPNGPDIEFSGNCLIDRHYMGMGRLQIYKTAAGQFVYKQKRSASRHSTALHRVDVFSSFDELASELAKSWAGKDILEEFGQPSRRIID